VSLSLTRHSASFLLALVLAPALCQANEPTLQSNLEQVLAEEGLTGISWALLDRDGDVTLGTAGLRDNASGTAFTTDTRFHVGSIAKSLLATGVLRLATTGAIDLDAPVDRYLPDLPINNGWQNETPVTVRHLLDHTSGLDDTRLWQMFSERPQPDTPLAAAFPEPETLLRIRVRPGSRFSYSNMGYTLLGMIVEAVTGERYETWLDRQLLPPLRMHDSTFLFTTQEDDSADPTLAWGHVDDGSRYTASPVFLRPAGQFTTTAGDLARYLQFILSDGRIDDRTFIDVTLMRARGRPSTTEAAQSGLVAGYALGLVRRDRHGVVGYCHGGDVVGFVAMLCLFPDERKGFAYSVNTDSETADYDRIDGLLIDALQIAEAPPPPSAEPAADAGEWAGHYVLSPNRFQTFAWLDTVFGSVRISEKGGAFKILSLQRSARELRPLGGYLFVANDRRTASHVFVRGENGEYLVSDGFNTFRKVPTAYLAAHWASVLLGAAGFIWLFFVGIVSLVRDRTGAFRRPEAPAWMAILLLPVPVPLFMTQSFMAMGDLTLASGTLAAVTLLLPVGLALAILRIAKHRDRSRTALLHGLAAAFVLQSCAVLATAGLLPLRLWS
jgi:CubicO group peptidase (beta-lactamase class C family)